MKKKEVIVAEHAGFCFGVNRAVKMAEKELAKGSKVYSLGSLIHNPQVVADLEAKGFQVVKSAEEVPAGEKVIIRSHGTTKWEVEKLQKKHATILDATCPFVKKAQLVAENFAKEKVQVVIFGDPEHAEVIGVKSYAGEDALVVADEKEASQTGTFAKVGLLSQTTQKKRNFQKVILELTNHTMDLHIINTICSDTSTKQNEVKELAQKVDLMMVVGGKESSNTKKLFQLSQANCPRAHHVETAAELKKEWLAGVKKVGIAAGASTPQKSITQMKEKIEALLE